jgi:hypothetical protein
MSSRSRLAATIGGAVGGVAVIILVTISLVCRHRTAKGVVQINGSEHRSGGEYTLHPTPNTLNVHDGRNDDNTPNDFHTPPTSSQPGSLTSGGEGGSIDITPTDANARISGAYHILWLPACLTRKSI